MGIYINFNSLLLRFKQGPLHFRMLGRPTFTVSFLSNDGDEFPCRLDFILEHLLFTMTKERCSVFFFWLWHIDDAMVEPGDPGQVILGSPGDLGQAIDKKCPDDPGQAIDT